MKTKTTKPFSIDPGPALTRARENLRKVTQEEGVLHERERDLGIAIRAHQRRTDQNRGEGYPRGDRTALLEVVKGTEAESLVQAAVDDGPSLEEMRAELDQVRRRRPVMEEAIRLQENVVVHLSRERLQEAEESIRATLGEAADQVLRAFELLHAADRRVTEVRVALASAGLPFPSYLDGAAPPLSGRFDISSDTDGVFMANARAYRDRCAEAGIPTSVRV